MDEPKLITLNLTLKELQQIDKFVEVNDDTLSVLTKIKDAYPQPKMHLKNEGEFSIVSYDTRTYCRLQLPAASFWYIETIDGYGGCALEMIEDIKTKNELESQWLVNDVKYQNDEEPYCPDEPTKPMNEVLGKLENKYKQAEENAASYITDEVVDRMLKKWEENPPDFLRFQLGKSLETRIYKWWETCFVHHPEWSMEECVEDLLDIITLFLPAEQSHEGTQNIDTVVAVEAHNELLQKIKSKLRNKK